MDTEVFDTLPNMALAHLVSITHKDTVERVPFKLTKIQTEILRACREHKWLMIAKPRQIYASTAVCLDDVYWTMKQALAGNKIACAIILDTDEKSKGRLRQCADFALQLGFVRKKDITSNRIVFPGGCEIVALTAGGKRAASSLSYGRYHLSEIPYWRDATNVYGSIIPALAKSEGECVIESTLDVTDPIARELWYGDNKYHKLFFGVEDHDAYRADPDSITDEDWEWLQGEGYTDRAAAAWFRQAIENEFAGDVNHAFRLYPQKPEHMFRMAGSLWVRAQPEVTEPVARHVIKSDVHSNEQFQVQIFRPESEGSGQYIIGVDVAAGIGRDASAISVIDKSDEFLCASLRSSTIIGHDLEAAIAEVQRMYTHEERPVSILDPVRRVPAACIETNGIGNTIYQNCAAKGLHVIPVTTNTSTQYAGMQMVKLAIERGHIYGPPELLEEAEGCYRNEHGKFEGPKDLLMSIGFALNQLSKEPYVEPKEQQGKHRMGDFKARMRQAAARRRATF